METIRLQTLLVHDKNSPSNCIVIETKRQSVEESECECYLKALKHRPALFCALRDNAVYPPVRFNNLKFYETPFQDLGYAYCIGFNNRHVTFQGCWT